MWTVEFHQRKGRAEPHQGHVLTEDEAKAQWKRCWGERGRDNSLATVAGTSVITCNRAAPASAAVHRENRRCTTRVVCNR